jgi:L-ascorbate metabolism protein UlaG (beta-lactamase superfamily)
MVRMTYIGGPTVLVEFGGIRLLTDPTFDPAGGEYATPAYTLRKLQGPAVDVSALGRIDAVLLSHDHHFDNLDHSGRRLLADVPVVLTTEAGAARLGAPAVGLSPWQTFDLGAVRVTATPARHGPSGGDRGPVVGFVLLSAERREEVVYLSGDTVWYDDLLEVASRFQVRTAVLFMGAARVAAAGPSHLTFTGAEGVAAARAFADATIVPVHFEGWEHFSESRAVIEAAFADAGLQDRLRWLPPGQAVEL